jgi:hypothetical protein
MTSWSRMMSTLVACSPSSTSWASRTIRSSYTRRRMARTTTAGPTARSPRSVARRTPTVQPHARAPAMVPVVWTTSGEPRQIWLQRPSEKANYWRYFVSEPSAGSTTDRVPASRGEPVRIGPGRHGGCQTGTKIGTPGIVARFQAHLIDCEHRYTPIPHEQPDRRTVMAIDTAMSLAMAAVCVVTVAMVPARDAAAQGQTVTVKHAPIAR